MVESDPKRELAEAAFEKGDFPEAKKYFLEAKLLPQAAFSCVMMRDLNNARKLYEMAPYSIAKKWGLFLCLFLDPEAHVVKSPGYLTMRHFFESTICYFIKNDLSDYLEKVILHIKDLEQIFPDLRKYIGTAHLALGDANGAIKFLKEAQKNYPRDVEVYYKLGEAYHLMEKYKEANNYFEKVLELLPGHRSSLFYLGKLT